ncbi:MAG: polysaccharide pyruvyl transferase family protein [Marinilabiliaceae bacterium]|nr:polysaccharide pyruvyl transferase family protein [Marinilabiliaceae bacterium]
MKPIGQVKIGFLSTYYENIGDDFIRIGITHLLQKVMQKKTVIDHFSKSNRLSLYFRKSRFTHAPRWQMGTFMKWLTDKIYFRLAGKIGNKTFYKRAKHIDLFVIAGTPLFFFTKEKYTFLKNAFWPRQFFDIIKHDHPQKPVFAIGVGSIYTGEPDALARQYAEEFHFMNDFYNTVQFCSFRDSKTGRLFQCALNNGKDDIKILPCPSIFSARHLGVVRNPENVSDQIVISYSEESANSDTEKEKTIIQRRKALDVIVNQLKVKGFPIVFFAHNKVDKELHHQLAKKYPFVETLSGTSHDLLKTLSVFRMLITWRVHGAMGAASIGCPVLLFKTDSRSTSSELFNVEVIDDRQLLPGQINDKLISMLNQGVLMQQKNVETVDFWEQKYLEELKVAMEPLD